MTLLEVIQTLGELDSEATIYAAEPWSAASAVVVAREAGEGQAPPAVQDLGFVYFLEVSIADDFLKGWASMLGRVPTPEQQCERLIYYARYDA